MTTKQIMRITTIDGVEDIDADRILIENNEYVLFRGDEEVRRIPIADIISETDPETGESGRDRTIYSKATIGHTAH